MSRISPITWAALAIGAIAIPWLWFSGDPLPPEGGPVRRDAAAAVPASESVAARADAMLPSRPPLDSYTAIVERPLFSPLRRPASLPLTDAEPVREPEALADPVEEEPPIGEPLPEPSLRLVGTLVDAQGRALAIVEEAGANARTTLALGDSLDGWRLESVGNGSIEIRSGDRLVRIGLKGPK